MSAYKNDMTLTIMPNDGIIVTRGSRTADPSCCIIFHTIDGTRGEVHLDSTTARRVATALIEHVLWIESAKEHK